MSGQAKFNDQAAGTPVAADILAFSRAGALGSRKIRWDDLYNAVPILQSGSGGVQRTIIDRFQDSVTAFDFMTSAQRASVRARASSVDVYSPINTAIANLQARGGGVLELPSGVFRLDTSLTLSPNCSDGWHNIILRGQGKSATVLNFANCAAGSDGIKINGYGGVIGIENMTVLNAPAIGINVTANPGALHDGVTFISRIFMSNVRVDTSGTHGIKMMQVYVGKFDDLEARNSGLIGFNLLGFHDALQFNNCWAGGDYLAPQGGNASHGWYIDGTVYSAFNNCYADWSGANGYFIRNCTAVKFTACGAESNLAEGFLVESSTADPSGFLGVAPISFDSCFGNNNSQAGTDTYANFLGIKTANSKDAHVSIVDCSDSSTISPPNTVSVVLNGASGTVYTEERGNRFMGTVNKSGTIDRTNYSVIGRSTIAQLSIDIAVATTVDYKANLDTIVTNRLGATMVSNGVIIPAGVSRVKVSAGCYWNTNSTGSRTVKIYLNGSPVPGGAEQKNAANLFTQVGVTTGIFECAAGDSITMIVYQSSGGYLNLLANSETFMSVEAMG